MRPRLSRGTLRWITKRREIAEGAFAKPDMVTKTMAMDIEAVCE